MECSVCLTRLPLLPHAGPAAPRWQCVRCGATYSGIFDEQAPREIRANAIPAKTSPLPTRPADSSRAEFTKSALTNPATTKPTGNPLRASGTVKSGLPARKNTNYPPVPPSRLTSLLDAQIERYRELEVTVQTTPLRESIVPLGTQPFNPHTTARFSNQHEQSVQNLDRLFLGLSTSAKTDIASVQTLTNQTVAMITEDFDVTMAVGINPTAKQYPSRHSMHMTMLAMSIGVTMGFDEPTLQSLGYGCLLHDIGMLGLADAVHTKPAVLEEEDFAEITTHPTRTFDFLEQQITRVPVAARMVAYQMHERCDGSGYPCRRKQTQIHALARVAAVADVYVALVSPRPFRPALMPHHAMKTILFGVRDGLFDGDVVRALLNSISLFPIGSYVRLNDGRVGNVMRAFGQPYDRPVVEVWPAHKLNSKAEIIDLAQQPNLRVEAAIGSLTEPTKGVLQNA